MIDFVGAPKFSRITQWVAMETMRFHIAKKVYFYFVLHERGSDKLNYFQYNKRKL